MKMITYRRFRSLALPLMLALIPCLAVAAGWPVRAGGAEFRCCNGSHDVMAPTRFAFFAPGNISDNGCVSGPASLEISCCYSQDTGGSGQPRYSNEVLRLWTDSLPTPIEIMGNPRKRSVTSLEIRGELGADGDGKGTVTLDETTFTFNEFGDATKLHPHALEPCQVAFRQVKLQRATDAEKFYLGEGKVAKTEKRLLYEIVFADGSFPKQMFLVLSDGTNGPHRLLIHRSNAAVGNGEEVLDLQGRPEIKEPLPDTRLRSAFDLTGLSSDGGRKDDELHILDVRGTVRGPVYIQFDGNALTFNVLGDIIMRTAMYSFPVKFTLKPIKIPDPANKGRLLFEAQADKEQPQIPFPFKPRTREQRPKMRYFLVLSRTDAGPHRLLIRDGENLRNVVPLHDPERRYHLAMQPQLEETPLQERQAIADLRRAIGYRFRFKIEEQRVVELSIDSHDDMNRVGPALKHLTNLRSLEFNGSRLSALGVANLQALNKLKHLRFAFAQIHNRGLASVKALTQLPELDLYCCQGITDEGMVHLAGLKHLKSLELYREDSLLTPDLKVELITNAGLKHLERLKELEVLNLMGQRITDAGLEYLEGLTSIKDLYLSGEGITDSGLQHLKILPHLEKLQLHGTRVTLAGRAALQSSLPKLKIEN